MSIEKVLDKILKGTSDKKIKFQDIKYGKTYEAAITNTLVITKEWITTAKELGRNIPKPGGRLIYA
jgi:hypothetical protein